MALANVECPEYHKHARQQDDVGVVEQVFVPVLDPFVHPPTIIVRNEPPADDIRHLLPRIDRSPLTSLRGEEARLLSLIPQFQHLPAFRVRETTPPRLDRLHGIVGE
jgi:hypothetical protein